MKRRTFAIVALTALCLSIFIGKVSLRNTQPEIVESGIRKEMKQLLDNPQKYELAAAECTVNALNETIQCQAVWRIQENLQDKTAVRLTKRITAYGVSGFK